MKILPFGVFWGVLLLLKGLCCNAQERFHFYIGDVVQGSLVMDQTVDHSGNFQIYQFSETHPEHFVAMFRQIGRLHYSLPAIIFWLQTMPNGENTERNVRIKRWSIGSNNGPRIKYFLFGPDNIQPSLTQLRLSVVKGIPTLLEALLQRGGFTFAGVELAFFDPFLYDKVILLHAVDVGSLVQSGEKEVVSKVWKTRFQWDTTGDATFSSLTNPLVQIIDFTVTAQYKRGVLKSYRVQITGVPEILFQRMLQDEPESERSGFQVRTEEFPRQVACYKQNNAQLPTGQFGGYYSFDAASHLSSNNASPRSNMASGWQIKLEQNLASLTGCTFRGGAFF